MKTGKSQSILAISAVAFVAALLIDLYLIFAAPSNIGLIIAVSLIVIVDTYFLVDGILEKVDEIVALNIDKQNELTKVEKGIYSVAKREEISRNQSMSAMLNAIVDIREQSAKSYVDSAEQDKMLTKLCIKKDMDNANKIINSNERIAVLIAKMATANAKSSDEAIHILNDICRGLEQGSQKEEAISRVDADDADIINTLDKADNLGVANDFGEADNLDIFGDFDMVDNLDRADGLDSADSLYMEDNSVTVKNADAANNFDAEDDLAVLDYLGLIDSLGMVDNLDEYRDTDSKNETDKYEDNAAEYETDEYEDNGIEEADEYDTEEADEYDDEMDEYADDSDDETDEYADDSDDEMDEYADEMDDEVDEYADNKVYEYDFPEMVNNLDEDIDYTHLKVMNL